MAPDAVELTRRLLQFNTINPPGVERASARFLGELLADYGFRVDYSEFAPERTSVIARLGGVSGKLPLGFTGHLDTVPLGAAAWTRNAFGASLEGGKLYGRGSSDMKSGIAAFVVAALRLAPKLEKGPGVTLVLTADEETGCQGSLHLIEQPELLGRVGALIIGEPTGNYPLLGHKGALWLELVARGVTAHGSMPERGDNAIYKAVAAIEQLRRFDFETPAHTLMGAPTLNVGTVRGGLNINSVPDEAVIGVDIRTVPGQDHSALVSRLERALEGTAAVRAIVDVAGIYSEPSHPWIQEVFAASAGHLGSTPVPRAATYFTDGAVLERAYCATPMVILGPGQPELAHQTDEYCVLERVEQAAALYGELLERWHDLPGVAGL